MVNEGNKTTPPSSPTRGAPERQSSSSSIKQVWGGDDWNCLPSQITDNSMWSPFVGGENTLISWEPFSDAVNVIWKPSLEASTTSNGEHLTPTEPFTETSASGSGDPSATEASAADAAAAASGTTAAQDRALHTSVTEQTEIESHGSSESALKVQEPAEKETNIESSKKKKSKKGYKKTEPSSRDSGVVVSFTCRRSWALLACFVVVLIVVGVVAYFGSRSELAEPTRETQIPPSSQTLTCLSDPPLPEDCDQVRFGEAVQGQDSMTERNFDVVLDVALGVQVKEGGRGGVTRNEIMELLEVEMQVLLMPKLVGCSEAPRQRLRHHRMLSSTNPNHRYIVGNGKVHWLPALLEETEGCSSQICFRATFNMDLFLKCAEEEQQFVIEDLVADIFGDDLVDSMPLESPTFASVVVRSLIHKDPLAPSATPSLAPTSTPSLIPSTTPSFAPSDSPSLEPSTAPSSAPSSIPSTAPSSTPSVMPSTAPSPTPSVMPSTAPSSTPSTTPSNMPTPTPTTQGPTAPPTPGPTLSPTVTAIPTTTPSLVPTMDPTVAPTLHPTPWPTPSPTMVPSSSPTASNQLVLLGVYPLRECAGDCDNDNDCASGLFCFERNALEAVPGCIGSGQTQMDYCYNPGSGFKRLEFYGNLVYDYYELGQCEGDCDYDSDCGIGLVCYDREGGDSGSVPTCVGNANIIGFGDDDFCIPRPASNTLMSVFESEVGGDVAGGGVFPIPRCAGDCDSDTDCEPGLTCFQRTGYNAVPGCSGFGEEDFDYCI